MRKIIFILLYFLLSLGLNAQAQEKARKDLYFKLDSAAVNYSKTISTYTSPYSKREFTLNIIAIKCDCHIAGWLSFSGHTNEDVGDTSEPAKVISDSAYKKLELISFDELVRLLKQHDLRFNDIYNLYFVESSKKEKGKYTVYNVKFRNSFIDNQ